MDGLLRLFKRALGHLQTHLTPHPLGVSVWQQIQRRIKGNTLFSRALLYPWRLIVTPLTDLPCSV